MARRSKDFGELLKQAGEHFKQQGQRNQSAKSDDRFSGLEVTENPEIAMDASSDFDEQERRIGQVVGVDPDGSVLEVSHETLSQYRDYLQQQLELPCLLTGIEDFDWEEKYFFGVGSKQEHERLRKTKPSYLDTYEFLHIEERIDGWRGLLVAVRRLEDGKTFVLPLADLKATDQQSLNYQRLHDYSVWFVNWRR
jgi:hypothetical protein